MAATGSLFVIEPQPMRVTQRAWGRVWKMKGLEGRGTRVQK